MAIAAALSGLATGMGLAGSVLNIYPPLGVGYQKRAFAKTPNMIPTVGDLVEMHYRGIISEGEFIRTCKENGFNELWSSAVFNASHSLLNGYEYLTLWRRGTMSDKELDIALDNLHYSELTKERLKRVTEYFPNPADLVRFAVREVYTPDVAARFGLFEDIPQRFIDEAYKTGLSEEHAYNFWGAHWDLPSAGQGFEMLHRRIIEEGDVKLLLKALDVMPYWRDRLIQLSYNPLTRVDVRRMYRLGVLDENAVYNSYLDLGYSPENADLMTKFTKVYESDETVGVSRANVVEAYKRDLITLEDVYDFLVSFGYAEEVIAFWVNMAEYEKASELLADHTKELIAQYRKGIINIEDVRNALLELDVPASYIAATVDSALATQSEKIKLPSKTDLENWLDGGIIDEGEYFIYMSELGYKTADIHHYLTQYALKRDTSKRRFLNIKSYQRWLKVGIMNTEEFAATATLMSISKEDIANLIMEVKDTESESS